MVKNRIGGYMCGRSKWKKELCMKEIPGIRELQTLRPSAGAGDLEICNLEVLWIAN